MTGVSRGMFHFWLFEAFIELAGSRPYKSVTVKNIGRFTPLCVTDKTIGCYPGDVQFYELLFW